MDTWPIYCDQPSFADFLLQVDETTLRVLSPTNGATFAANEMPVFTINTPLAPVDGVIQSVEYRYSDAHSELLGGGY